MRAATSTPALVLLALAAVAQCQLDTETCVAQERKRRECVGGARLDALIATAKCLVGSGCEEPRLAPQLHDAGRRRCIAAALGVDIARSVRDCLRAKGFGGGGGSCPDAALVVDTQCPGAAACVEDDGRAADEQCGHATVSPECVAMRNRARCECVQQLRLDKEKVLAAVAACEDSVEPPPDKPQDVKDQGGPLRVKRSRSYHSRRSYQPQRQSYSQRQSYPRRSSYSNRRSYSNRGSYKKSNRGYHYRGKRAGSLHHGGNHYPHYPHHQGGHHRAQRSAYSHGHGHGYPYYPHYPKHHGGHRGKRAADGAGCAQLIDADCANLPEPEFGGKHEAMDEWCKAD